MERGKTGVSALAEASLRIALTFRSHVFCRQHSAVDKKAQVSDVDSRGSPKDPADYRLIDR